MSTYQQRFFPEQAIGQSSNGPGYEGAISQAMGTPATLLLTGGNVFDIFPVLINPTPENRSDPMVPVGTTGSNGSAFPTDAASAQQVPNYPATNPILKNLADVTEGYWLMHFTSQPFQAQGVNGGGSYTEIVSGHTLQVDSSQIDGLTGGLVFSSDQQGQFAGFTGLDGGVSFASDPGSFYVTVWVYLNQTPYYPSADPGQSDDRGISGTFFYIGNDNQEVPAYQVLFGLADNVPFAQLTLQTPTLEQVVKRIVYPISLDQSGAGFYQFSLYFFNDGSTITYGGSVGSTDEAVYMGGPSLQFVPKTTIPAPNGFNSLVASSYNAGFTSSDPNYTNPNLSGYAGLDFVAFRALCENTAITGNDPATQIINDFNHFSGLVSTQYGVAGEVPALNLIPTGTFVSGATA